MFLKLLLFILFALLSALIIHRALNRYKNKWRAKIRISLIHGAVLTIVLLFFFNLPTLVLDEGMSLLSYTNKIDRLVSPEKEEKAYKFIKDYFILVDNSNDKSIEPDPDADPETKRGIVITDRQKINRLMKLAVDSADLIDLMVCDVTFNTATSHDTILYQNMSKVAATNRLLLADDMQVKENEVLKFDASVYGVIRERVEDQTYTVHTLVQNNHLSLPFKLYSKIDGFTNHTVYLNGLFASGRNKNGKRTLFYNRFIPSFKITDEEKLRITQNEFSGVDSDTFSLSNYHYAKLGDVVTDDGIIDFTNNLIARKKEGLRNIVFIGAFESENEDIHNTAYGRLHGATILLNVIFTLHLGQHHVDWTTILINLFFLAFITWGVFYKIEKKIEMSGTLTRTFIELLTNSLAFIVIMGLGLLSQWITGQNLNMVSLIVYFIAFYKFLKELEKDKPAK